MDLDRARRLRRLFDGALDCPSAQRSAWLDLECGADDALRSEVDALLHEYDALAREPEVTPEVLPRAIGRFEVVRRLGGGGMGDVYLARDPGIDRLVAIKVLQQDFAREPHYKDRFKREAKAAGNLRHPNIVTIFEFGEEDGQPFLVMEYVDGRTLFDVIADREALPLARKLHLLEQLCDGLECAHRAGLIHRDIKPGNLIVDQAGTLRIVDFGIVKPTRRAPGQAATVVTAEHARVGTIGYIAPEHLAGADIDHRGDLFAAAVVAYEFLTFARPFGSDVSEIIRRTLLGEPTPIAHVAPDLPASVTRAVTRGLAVRPIERQAGMGVLGRSLRSAREELASQVLGDTAPELFEAAAPAPSRRGLLLTLAAAGAVGVALVWSLADRPTPSGAAVPRTAELAESATSDAATEAAQPGLAAAPPGASTSRPAGTSRASRGASRGSGSMPGILGAAEEERRRGPGLPVSELLPSTAARASVETAGADRTTSPSGIDTPADADSASRSVHQPVSPGTVVERSQPAPVVAPVPAAEDRAGVSKALRSFEAAFRNSSTPALKLIQPSLTREQLAVFERRFLDNASYAVRLRNERVTFDSPTTARVSCLLDEDFAPLAGQSRHVTSPASVELALQGTSWVITRVRSQGWQ